MQACADYRAKSDNESSKLFFKTVSNAIFGKSMESVRRRQDIHFYNDIPANKHNIIKKLSRKTFKQIIEYGNYVQDGEDVEAVEDTPPEVGGIFKILIVGILVGIC